MEKGLLEEGRSLEEASLGEMEHGWERAKASVQGGSP